MEMHLSVPPPPPPPPPTYPVDSLGEMGSLSGHLFVVKNWCSMCYWHLPLLKDNNINKYKHGSWKTFFIRFKKRSCLPDTAEAVRISSKSALHGGHWSEAYRMHIQQTGDEISITVISLYLVIAVISHSNGRQEWGARCTGPGEWEVRASAGRGDRQCGEGQRHAGQTAEWNHHHGRCARAGHQAAGRDHCFELP